MVFGKIWSCDRIQFRCYANVSLGGVVTPADGGLATLSTKWAVSKDATEPGIGLAAGRKGTQARFVRLQIPALGIDTGSLYGSSGNGGIEALLEIDGLTYHLGGGDPPLWRVSWSAMRLYRDGSLVWSAGSGVYSDPLTCQRVAPSGVPFMGVPPKLEAAVQALMPSAVNCSISPNDPPNLYSNIGPHTLEAEGGWRFRETPASAWVELPVDCTVVSPPGPPDCQCPTPTLAVPEAGTTWNAKAYAACGGTGGTSFRGYNRGSSVVLLPSLPKGFSLMSGEDYAALWVRGGFPGAKVVGTVGSHRCAGLNQPVTDCADTREDVRHQPQSVMLSTVVWEQDPNSPSSRIPHPIEDPVYGAVVKAPYELWSHEYNTSVWPQDCSVIRSSEWPVLFQTSDVLPYLRHSDSVCQYIDTWANPHWSYFYWFPAPVEDPEEPLHDWEWPVDGERVPTDGYWVPLRTQWLHHPALPEREKRRTRTTLMSAPLLEGAYGNLIRSQYVAGATTSWVGVCRFDVLTPSPPSSLTPDSSSSAAWSSPDANLSFGATAVTISNNGSNNGDRTVWFDVGRWESKPWMYGSWVSLLGFYWSSAQVDKVRLEAEGADGTLNLVYEGKTVPSAQPIPFGSQTKYAGSWAQNYGMGIVQDSPTDFNPTKGISGTLMADPETVGGFRLPKSRGISRLKITVSPTTPSQSVAFNYPVHYRPSSGWFLYPENGSQQAVFWPSKGFVRLGQRVWWDSQTQTVRQTPVAAEGPGSAYAGFGYKQSALDGLCDLASIFEGADRTANLQTRLTGFYDATELGGQTSPPGLYSESDERTLSWWTAYGSSAPTLALANGWREIPPLAVLPRRERPTQTMQETGDWCQRTYDWCHEPRYVVSPDGHPASLFPPDGQDVLTDANPGGFPSGWSVRKHRTIVDNAEKNWLLKIDGSIKAKVRPWHGWVCIPEDQTPPSGGLSNFCTYAKRYAQAATMDSAVYVRSYYDPWAGSVAAESVPVESGARDACLAGYDGTWILVSASEDGTVSARTSTDMCQTWSGGAVLFDGGKTPRVAVSNTGTVVYAAFVPNSGTGGPGRIKIRVESPFGSAPSAETTVKDAAGVDLEWEDAGFDIVYAYGRWMLLAVEAGDSEATNWVSYDNLATVRKVL